LKPEGYTLNVVPIFLLGNRPTLRSKDDAGLDAETGEMLVKYGLKYERKHLVRKDEDLLDVGIKGVDCFVLLPCCAERFSPLIYMAESGLPVIIAGDEQTFCHALETYEYLADHGNVEVAFSPEEVKRKIRVLEAAEWVRNAKVCLFDAEGWELRGMAWNRNPLVMGRLNAQSIDTEKFFDSYENADAAEAEGLARRWIEESEVLEPSLGDVVRSARLYTAMKSAIDGMGADAGYVLWCGQFTERLGTKMCFALSKLAEEGYPVGCWRGENLLPLLMLRSASGKPVFICEAFTRRGDTVTLRHCFAPGSIASGGYVLKRWRDKEGTVTGYVQLPRGRVTLVNCGIGDRMSVFRGEVLDCRDLGGENCRMTITVRMEEEESIRNFLGRECAMVYGDYAAEAREIGARLGLEVL
jgi:L-fucose isomerase-like protein